jgi:hypothetical protein
MPKLTSFFGVHFTAIHFCSELKGISFFLTYESLMSLKFIWGNRMGAFFMSHLKPGCEHTQPEEMIN